MFGVRRNGFNGGGNGGGGGTPTGWETMLEQNQPQQHTNGIDINGYGLFFNNANFINIDTANGFGNLSDGTWQINNDGSGFIGGQENNIGILIGYNSHGTNGITAIGDYSGNVNNTNIIIDDALQTQTFNANNGFTFSGTQYTNGIIYANPNYQNSNTGYVGIGDYTNKVQGTAIIVDDLIGEIDFKSFGGFNFIGGSTISSDGDLSLMNGNAGIFSDGYFKCYDENNGEYTIFVNNEGFFRINSSMNDAITLQSDGNGQFSIIDKISGIQTLSVNSSGAFQISDVGGIQNFYVDNAGLQTIDARNTIGLSPNWKLGAASAGVGSPTQLITVSIGGVLYDLLAQLH